MTPYHTDNFTDIIIHPRGEEDVNIAAYYYPGDPSRNVAGETIILTPGFGASRTKYTLLLPARILQQLGFNVVSIDTRSHGESDAYMDRKTTWGYLEHKDTLGAWDWAVQNLAGGDTSRVGLMGASLGGCISKIAFGTERRVPGLFLDSPAYSLQRALEHRMAALYVLSFLESKKTRKKTLKLKPRTGTCRQLCTFDPPCISQKRLLMLKFDIVNHQTCSRMQVNRITIQILDERLQ